MVLHGDLASLAVPRGDRNKYYFYVAGTGMQVSPGR